jgi:hypothetical protein
MKIAFADAGNWGACEIGFEQLGESRGEASLRPDQGCQHYLTACSDSKEGVSGPRSGVQSCGNPGNYPSGVAEIVVGCFSPALEDPMA